MKKIPKKTNNKRIIILLVIASVFFLSIGYANSSANGTIENAIASVRPQAYARITDVNLSSTAGGGISNSEGYNMNNIFGSVTLPNANSEVTYKVDVTVFLSAIMMIKSISGLPSNLEYVLTDYTLEDPLCNSHDECNYGAVDEFYITIKYKENGYNSSNTTYPFNLNFVFENLDKVAKVGNIYFDTLQDAIDAVVADDNETTVILLKDTSESITINNHKNIKLNLQEYTLSNTGNTNVINNNGTLKIYNGVIFSDASTQGAVNNNSTGNITISGGSIIMTGGRQALYNNGGTARITGTAYLSNTTSERSAVHNLAGSTLYIEGGKIVATGTAAVRNLGTMTIGIEDGDPDETTPIMQGKTYGIESAIAYDFFNGISKGKTKAVSDDTVIDNIESNYEIVKLPEVIDGATFNTLFLGINATVSFDGNGGTPTESTRSTAIGRKVGTLPGATKVGYTFAGWFTDPDDGTEITEDTVVTTAITTYYAHWLRENVARYNGNIYYTLQDAIDAVPTNTPSTITLLKSIKENITIAKNKNITFDFQSYTITNNTALSTITNNGTVTITNGNITTNSATTAVINNNSTGTITISGGRIISTGLRQALYNDKGRATITGNAYLESSTTGSPSGSTMERGTAHNLTGGTMIITGGTIVGNNQQAVSNEGTLTIGAKDGSIITTTPVIRGKTYGVKSKSTFNFYDGIIKGQTNAISGTVSDIEPNSTITNSTETIDGVTYITAYLS